MTALAIAAALVVTGLLVSVAACFWVVDEYLMPLAQETLRAKESGQGSNVLDNPTPDKGNDT